MRTFCKILLYMIPGVGLVLATLNTLKGPVA